MDSCSIGAFWVMPSPFLRKALTDERMIGDGFWESFFVMESDLGESWTRERRRMPLDTLPKWEETVAQLHGRPVDEVADVTTRNARQFYRLAENG